MPVEIAPLLFGVAASIAKDVGVLGLRKFITQRQDQFGSAIKGTCSRISGIEGTETALLQWISSETFIGFFESIYEGERCPDTEIVNSFIKDGGFYLPIEAECISVAEEIVMEFLQQLLGVLYRSDDALPALANRMEVLHQETKGEIISHVEDGFAGLKTDLPALLAQAMALTGPNEIEASQDEEFTALSKEIDFAAELINRGLISSARTELERIESQTEDIPDELKFRIITNMAACALADEENNSARTLLEDAHSLQPGNQKGIANAALAAQIGGDSKRAISMAQEARALNTRDSQATSVLIEEFWEIGDVERLEELVETEEWIAQDRQCLLVLASIRTRQNRWEEAVALCRSVVEIDSEDASAHLALSQFLLNYAQSQCQLTGYTKDTVRLFQEAKAEATLALGCLTDTQMNAQSRRCLVIRACACSLLGETGDATHDFDAVLAVEPTHADAAFNKGLLLLHEGRPSEARMLLEGIKDPERTEDVIIPLAEACLASGDAPAAVKLLRGEIAIERPRWDDIHKAEILCQAEAELGEEDSIESCLRTALKLEPTNPLLLTLDSTWRSHHNDADGTEYSLMLALEHAGQGERIGILVRLAVHYQTTKQFSKAADRWAEIVGGVASQPAAITLLACMVNSQRFREALEWARKIQQNHPSPPLMAVEVEAQILQHVGDVRAAVPVYQTLCDYDDSTAGDQLLLALVQLRSGDMDAARGTVLDISSTELRLDPRAILKLAQLKLVLELEGYLQDAYLARRCGMDDPQIHLGYFLLFQSRGEDWVEPETVGPGCAVLLKGEATNQWWHILEDGEDSQDRYELPTRHELSRRLSGRRVGDVVVLREGLEDLSYEIVAIQSKFVRSFQEISEDFSTRFPDNTGLSRITVEGDDFSKIFETVDQRNKFVTEAEQLYNEGRLPFGSFASLVGMSTLEAWNAFTQSPSTRIRFGNGSDEEATEANDLLAQANGVVLDILALLAVYELGFANNLRRRYSRIAVPQQVIDEIQQALFTTRVYRSAPGYLGKAGDGRYTLTEVPDDLWSRRREYLQSVLDLAESFDRIAAFRLLDNEYREDLFDAFTAAGVGAAYAGDEQRRTGIILVCDDLVLSRYSRSEGVRVVNTQAVLRELHRSGKINGDAYSSYVEQLALLNYWFVRVGPEDIVRRLEANGYLTTRGIHAMLDTLAGPDCTESSAVSVGAKVVAGIAGKAPPAQVELVMAAVLATLRRGRATTTVLTEFRKAIADAPTLGPFTKVNLLKTVDLSIWLSTRR